MNQISRSNARVFGGAHLYDTRSGQQIRFPNLFSAWDQARPLLQKSLCTELRNRNAEYRCPEIEKQGLSLLASGTNVKSVGVFMVETQDYELGSYADGQETVSIELTPELLGMIKPEYRSEFTLSGVQ